MACDSGVFIPSQLLTGHFWIPLIGRLQDLIDGDVADHTGHDSIGALAQATLDCSPPRFNLFAHGMGGFIAFEMWRQAPKRIERLALFGTLAGQDGPAQTQRRMNYLRLVESGRFEAVVEERLPLLVHPNRRHDEALLAAIRQMAHEIGPVRFLRQQRAIMNRLDSRATLGEIDCPVLIVYGKYDGITSLAHQREMLDANPGASLRIVEHCGHLAPFERPDLVAPLVAEWLSETR